MYHHEQQQHALKRLETLQERLRLRIHFYPTGIFIVSWFCQHNVLSLLVSITNKIEHNLTSKAHCTQVQLFSEYLTLCKMSKQCNNFWLFAGISASTQGVQSLYVPFYQPSVLRPLTTLILTSATRPLTKGSQGEWIRTERGVNRVGGKEDES